MAEKKKAHEAQAKELTGTLPAKLKKAAALEVKGSTTAVKVGGRRVAEVQPGGAWIRVPADSDAGGPALAAAVEAALAKGAAKG